MILHAAGPTKPEGGGLARTTGLRSSEWSAAKPDGPASEFASTRRRTRFRQRLPEKRQRRPAFLPTRALPTRAARTCGSKTSTCGSKTRRNPEPGKPSITLKADHSEGWAEDRDGDGDGDGTREVHVNTIEGIWTSLRNRLRRFRGVHKDHLSGYVAMFELAFNHDFNYDQVTPALLQRMCGV